MKISRNVIFAGLGAIAAPVAMATEGVVGYQVSPLLAAFGGAAGYLIAWATEPTAPALSK
jgi:hypothetical protein